MDYLIRGIHWEPAVEAAYAAQAEGNWEACGLLLADGHVQVCMNIADSPGRFALAHSAAMAALDHWGMGNLEAIWHSHPNGHPEPSESDWAGHPRGPKMIIIALHDDSYTIHVYSEDDRP